MAETISAIPALSSAPSKVVLSVTITSCPAYRASIKSRSSALTMDVLTSFPLASGAVSIWAINPMVGLPSVLAGRVAII